MGEGSYATRQSLRDVRWRNMNTKGQRSGKLQVNRVIKASGVGPVQSAQAWRGDGKKPEHNGNLKNWGSP